MPAPRTPAGSATAASTVPVTLNPELPVTLNPELPISERADDIAAVLREHQVVVVAGETGSGKTTQLPKICLMVGRERIAHTQPRRIAARSVAERIAEELKVSLGELVGYQVRFTKKAGRDTRVKVMTDGVLLNEISRDRMLRRYDTIIVDEAHERSLNIDFLLGYLKQLTSRRPELKVIVTSATIDTARFSAHFAQPDGTGAPVIEVSGRAYPVELRYQPLLPDSVDDDEAEPAGMRPVATEARDQVEAICSAVVELSAEPPGDVLVFLAGEREIRDTADALSDLLEREIATDRVELLALYARLSAAEQHKVFSSHTGRRIVLATNVAETSLTVPGVRYVVDPGTARISRYSTRTKVQRLPIEPVSQASANQRAGRCGRVAPGVCIRLYSEADFASRPEFTEPEILRTNLASVILQMTDAGLGEVADFPFVEPPDAARISDGMRLLTELGAIETVQRGSEPGRADTVRGPRLTSVGKRLAKIPVDPRMARMLVEADGQGCLREVLVIVAGLSIVDPRERPSDNTERADALHRRFWAPLPDADVDADLSTSAEPPPPDGSDFLAYLRLWTYLRAQQAALSGNAFRRMCRDEHLHYLRVREWQDLHTQLRDITKELGLVRNSVPAAPSAIHTALLSGLLSQVGLADLREEAKQTRGAARGQRRRRPLREYLGARGTRFAINPGSSVAKTQPELVMAGELVETGRLWARTVAGIEAEWVEQVGAHLVSRSYSAPHWSARSGSVVAEERVSLLGVPIIGGRRVNYAPIDPAEARMIFIQSALVEGQWRTRHHFFHRNAEVRAEAEQLEERSRRRDLLVDDQTIAAFYDQRIPAGIVSVAHFDSWWKTQRHLTAELLDLRLEDLVLDIAGAVDPGAFPDILTLPTTEGDPITVAVDYTFHPGSGQDGVQVSIPVQLVNRVISAPLSWQVPGLRTELATELIRSLPKTVRTSFVPAPDHATRALAWLAHHPGPVTETLPDALGRALLALTGTQVPDSAWDVDRVPDYLRIGVRVTDRTGDGLDRELARGRDLSAVREQLAPQIARSINDAAAALTRTGMTTWALDRVDERVELPHAVGAGEAVVGFPALTDETARHPDRPTVGLVVTDSPSRQAVLHRAGLRRLVTLNTPDPTRWVVSHLSSTDKFALGLSPYPSVPALLADARMAAVGDLVAEHADPMRVRNAAAFTALCERVRADNPTRMQAVVAQAAQILRADREARLALDSAPDGRSKQDMTEQRANLVFAGFLSATDAVHRADLVRYLRAIEQRAAAVRASPARDESGLAVISGLEDRYAELTAMVPPGPLPDRVEAVGWMLEELRVSLFAQSLGTRQTVSAKRVGRAIAEQVEQVRTARR